MKENTQEKSPVQVNENNILYKIKNFFRHLFNKDTEIKKNNIIDENKNINVESKNNRSTFIESIKNIENEETLILKLQKQYRSGEIKEEDLTQEQVNSLCALYDKQIANLKRSKELRKKKILEYRKKYKKDN